VIGRWHPGASRDAEHFFAGKSPETQRGWDGVQGGPLPEVPTHKQIRTHTSKGLEEIAFVFA
jgi:hypothetical protein